MLVDEDRLTADCLYQLAPPPRDAYPPLRGDADCEVCVVGGGVAGLSAAIELADRGRDVVLLETHHVGWGASGRNGGHLLVGLGCELDVVARQLGREDARRIWDLSVAAVELARQRCERFAIDAGLQAGYLHVATSPRRRDALYAWVAAMARDYGYDRLGVVERSALRRHVDSGRYLGGAFDPCSGHLEPFAYTTGLGRAAAALGVRIHEGSRARALAAAGGRLQIGTAAGTVRCAQAVLAGGVYLDSIAPRIAARIMPVGTFVAATAPLGAERAAALLPGNAAVSDTDLALDYFRRSPDHRLVFGGRVSYSTAAPRNLKASLRQRVLRVFPQLHDVPIAHAWGGFVDITRNRAPDFGRLPGALAGVHYLQGFSGHGLALSGMAGRLVAEAICGSAERFDLFARIRHRDFPGGRWLRMPALVLAMSWFKLRDALG